MAKSVRQRARQQALEAQARRRKARADAERRKSALAIDVAVALAERDAAVVRLEASAAATIGRLVTEEGLSSAEVVEWVDGIEVGEVRRLIRVAQSLSAEDVAD